MLLTCNDLVLVLKFNFWHMCETYSPRQKESGTILFKFWVLPQHHEREEYVSPLRDSPSFDLSELFLRCCEMFHSIIII